MLLGFRLLESSRLQDNYGRSAHRRPKKACRISCNRYFSITGRNFQELTRICSHYGVMSRLNCLHDVNQAGFKRQVDTTQQKIDAIKFHEPERLVRSVRQGTGVALLTVYHETVM